MKFDTEYFMLIFGLKSYADSTWQEADLNGAIIRRCSWIDEKNWDDCFSPTATLVEQAPHSVLPPHFHRRNQFQLFVRGGGSIGAHELVPYQLHYAGAYTGYGPIRAGAEGLSYLTLRTQSDSGAGFLPSARPALLQGPRRHSLSEQLFVPSSAAVEIRPVLGSAPDELFAEVVSLPPNSTIERCAHPLGQFMVVLEGAVTLKTTLLFPLEQMFFANEVFTLRSGDTGCRLIFMRMPMLDKTYVNAPAPDDAFFSVKLRPSTRVGSVENN